MIRRIVLENFMSHEHTELVLDAGVNVITGRNNIGKSAVAEALRCLTTGGHGSGFVLRHGAKKCSVTVETSEGRVITWTRASSGCVVGCHSLMNSSARCRANSTGCERCWIRKWRAADSVISRVRDSPSLPKSAWARR